MTCEEPCFSKVLSKMFGGIKTEDEILALTRKRINPLPCVRSGKKRPFTRIFPSVFAMYLLYEQGCAEYGEVVEAARRSLMGAWS